MSILEEFKNHARGLKDVGRGGEGEGGGRIRSPG